MVHKLTLVSIINKYYLNVNESVKWIIDNKTLDIMFVTPSKDVIGKIKCENFDCEDGKLVIYDTKKLLNLVNICSGELILEFDKNKNNPSKLYISDSTFNLIYALADPLLINKVGEVNTPDWDVKLNLDNEIINNLIKAKSSLSDVEAMSLITSLNLNGEEVCEFMFGDEKGHNNKVIYQIPGDIRKLNINIPFSSDIFKNILQANKDLDSGRLYLSEKGLMKLEFKSGDISSEYFLVRKSEQNI
jgi:hypothetical protein